MSDHYCSVRAEARRPMSIQFTSNVFRERDQFVSYAPELDVSSCGASETEAEKNLLEAVRLFLEEAGKMGTLEQVLEEAGYVRREGCWEPPELVRSERASLPLEHAEA